MFLNDLLDPRAINARVNATSKRQALSVISQIAERVYGVSQETVFEGLMARESISSTGLGIGVGVPHAAMDGFERVVGVFIRLETPIDFDAIDECPVDLIFALFAPKSGDTEHLRALAKVSRLLRHNDMRQHLRRLDTSDAIYALLTNGAESNAA